MIKPKIDAKVIRLTDANVNRAAEGLRVVEDVCRFVLDHSELSETIKLMRHELRSLYSNNLELIRLRDVEHDVGVNVADCGSQERADLYEIVKANFKRVQEALRVLEECAKLETDENGKQLEGLRYQSYEVEKELIMVLDRF